MDQTFDYARSMAFEEAGFGGKIARSIGASLSADKEDATRRALERQDDLRMQQAAQSRDWAASLAVLNFEERVTKTLECLDRRASFHNILYGLLLFCVQERSYEEAELHAQTFAEFEANFQSPRRYLMLLQRTGALEEIPYDEKGKLVTDELRERALEDGLEPDCLDTLAADWRVQTTDVGKEVIRLASPYLRLQALFAENPSRSQTYLKVLNFCVQPCQMTQIAEGLKDDPGLEHNEKGIAGMQPSAYVSKLNQAGGLDWKGGWVVTKGGKKIAETLQ